MADLHLDNDVALGLVPILTAAGHTATSARDLHLGHVFDYVQMLTAWDRGAVLLTHNRQHFVEQYEAWHVLPQRWGVVGPSLPGVVVPDQCDETVYGPELLAFLGQGLPLTGQLFAWRQRGGWQRWRIGSGWIPVS